MSTKKFMSIFLGILKKDYEILYDTSEGYDENKMKF